MDDREGPKIEVNCSGCKYLKQTREVDVESDEVDYTYDCTDLPMYLGYSTRTPEKCRFYPKEATAANG